MSPRTRRAVSVVAGAAAALTTLTILAVVGVRATLAQANAGPPAGDRAAEGVARHSSEGRLVVAVAFGTSGTVLSDALAPYEVFARSSRFSVYTVAEGPGPAVTQGGPSVVPVYTFADSAAGRAPRPDVVVVPAVSDPAGPREAPLRTWVAARAAEGARVLGVCDGASVLAATGLLDGRTATSHWSRIGALTSRYPDVHWVRGARHVDDGPVTTTAGVSSGIPGALHVMSDLAGEEEAARVGGTLAYPGWSLDGPTDIPRRSWAVDDARIGLNIVAPWGRPTVGIALADGVGEIDLAATFEVFDVSYAARPVAVAATTTTKTRHGMVLRGWTPDTAPTPTVLAVPGLDGIAGLPEPLREWAAQTHVPVEPVQGPDGSTGFDGALAFLSTLAGRETAVSAAKMVDYPSAHLRLADGGGLRVPTLVAIGVLLAAVAAHLPHRVARAARPEPGHVTGATFVRRRHRGRHTPGPPARSTR